MKVVHIPTGGLLPDGIFSCISSYIEAMPREDMEIIIIATNQPSEEMLARVATLRCHCVQLGDRKKNPVAYANKLYRYLKQEKPDIVHVHGSSTIMSIELTVAKAAACPVRIAHSHNTTCDNKKVNKILRPFFNRSYTHAFACGKDAGKWLFQDAPSVRIVRNARNLDKFSFNRENRERLRNKLGVNESTRVYGHVGRFNYQKNHEFLIRTFKQIAVLSPDSHLVLIGNGEDIVKIKELVDQLELEKQVTFLGAIDNVHEWISACDIMLLPSRFEGLPLVLIEWQANGLPCIISDAITDECCLTRRIYKNSIDSTKTWCDIARSCVIQDREAASKENQALLRAAGYDITIEAQNLKATYEKILKEVR